MNRKLKFIPAVILFFISCESRLYPPTYAPVLSNLVMTTSSFRSETTSGYEGDTVFFTLDVTDSEDDPAVLDLSILDSSDNEVQTEEFSDSRIIDGSYWDSWFETGTLAAGTYTLNFTAADTEGNISNVFTGSYTVLTDPRPGITPADVTFTYDGYLTPDDVLNTDNIATVFFTVENTSATAIDLVTIEFPVTVDSEVYTETVSVTDLQPGAGEARSGSVKYPIYVNLSPSPAPASGDAVISITFF